MVASPAAVVRPAGATRAVASVTVTRIVSLLSDHDTIFLVMTMNKECQKLFERLVKKIECLSIELNLRK